MAASDNTTHPANTQWILRAHPHHWGPGQIHGVEKRDTGQWHTICGKPFAAVPGDLARGDYAQITCKACLNSLQARSRWTEQQAKWAAEQKLREQLRDAERERRTKLYREYLQTTVWAGKRAAVLKRENYLCQGCAEQPATQVHHRLYPAIGDPGSPEWIRREKLFHLVALCRTCHLDVHDIQEEC